MVKSSISSLTFKSSIDKENANLNICYLKDHLYYQVQQLLVHNNIALDKKELEFQIQSHPSYPSLHAVTGVLDHFNIDNIALDVPIDEATLTQLPKCFLAQVSKEHNKEFAIVINKGLYYDVIHSKTKKSKLSISEFLEIFTGIIVGVEKTDLIEEHKNTNTIFKNSLIAISGLVLLSLFVLAKPDLIEILFFSTAIIGVLISISLKKQELGERTILGNAFCSGESKIKDCDAVLTSNGANVFGNYKLSDLSIIYFSGLTLSVFALSMLQIDLSLIFAITLLAFPITIYSIYYQAVVVKKWCLLCMSVVVVLWAQAAFVGFNYEAMVLTSITANTALVTAIGFLLALSIWNSLAPQLTDLQALKQIKIDHFKFKRNFNLFNTLLEQSQPIDTTIDGISEIVFGNPKASTQITIVTSPFCGHCKPIHSLIEEILKKYSEQVNILVRFSANTSDPDNALVKIASRLIELYHTQGPDTCLNAMHHIYNGQDRELWLGQFGVCNEPSLYFNSLDKESDWCKANALNFTPVILVNGKSYPKEYDRGDLIYFIEDLHEDSIINTSELQAVL